ncbi:hypothetical protein [Hymenobacter fodinae]|uniref:Uncharacterized protein n=1 Tax=Hymenobacter fodinae TaxID=2510796 RepID=A0A4Z0P0S3_9BACT|nr:hypothetical protein [Hymenobacter fodinae]TGE04854.1 hypothetical protein EU556_22000 [Hymenobacter fodinae]
MTSAPVPTLTAPKLPLRHRAWIALYSIANNPVDRAEIMRINNVTETDLQEYEESWRRMRRRVPPG